MKKQTNDISNGWIVINKPLGKTSSQVVGYVRRLLGIKKIGHAGTLDPLATGVLPLALGEACKLIPYVIGASKTYDFTLRWGTATTTEDAEGRISETSDFIPSKKEVLNVIPSFLGNIQQVPPKYSALKVDGKRAYELARQDKDFILASRPVHIHSLKLLKHDKNKKESSFEVICSKGTYVRSLARDIAKKSSSCGHVVTLKRTHVGPFFIENAILLESLEEIVHKEKVILFSLLSVLDDIPALVIGEHIAQRLGYGQKISIKTEIEKGFIFPQEILKAPVFKCLTKDHTLVALAKIEDGAMRVDRGFNL